MKQRGSLNLKCSFLTSLIFILVVGACVSKKVVIESQNYSLNEIHRAIIQISGEPREISENRREYISGYFSRELVTNPADLAKLKQRYFAHFRILGDRRPYTLEVLVKLENREGDDFVEAGIDEALTREVSKELKLQLLKIQEGRSFLENYKPF